MAADIQERTNVTFAITHDDNRYAAVLVGEIIAGFWNPATQSHHERIAAKKDLQFAIQPIGIRITNSGIYADIVREASGAGIDVLKQLVRKLDLQRMLHELT